MAGSRTGQSSATEPVEKPYTFVADIQTVLRKLNIERYCQATAMRRTGDGEQCDEIPECTCEGEFVTQTTLQSRFMAGIK